VLPVSPRPGRGGFEAVPSETRFDLLCAATQSWPPALGPGDSAAGRASGEPAPRPCRFRARGANFEFRRGCSGSRARGAALLDFPFFYFFLRGKAAILGFPEL